MNIRIYETGDLDLETIGDMLWQADRQANFHPDSRWILQASEIDLVLAVSTSKLENFSISISDSDNRLFPCKVKQKKVQPQWT